jgi:membrane protein DedA with SNARE-associated domain
MSAAGRPWVRWSVVGVVILALILVPFSVFGGALETWSVSFLEGARSESWITRGVVFGLLASDVLLPVPSSAVSTFAGASLGFWDGLLASMMGMTVGCLVGYGIGARLGRGAVLRVTGPEEMRRLEEGARRWGEWIVIATRPVPVLAEAAAMLAGVSRAPLGRFLVMTSLANAGVSAVYAAVGAFAAYRSSFLLAFTGAVVLPGLLLGAQRFLWGPRTSAVAALAEGPAGGGPPAGRATGAGVPPR